MRLICAGIGCDVQVYVAMGFTIAATNLASDSADFPDCYGADGGCPAIYTKTF
jgi:hypothetical protein